MKNYHELTRLGRIRRLRRLAETVLPAYGMQGAKLTFTHAEGNVIFRVDVPGGSEHPDGPYVPNRYNLRMLTTRDREGVKSELAWLSALSKEGHLPVPEPVPTLDGEYLIEVSAPDLPQGKLVSMMRWLDGRTLSDGLRPKHCRSLGELVGRLHNFSAGWQPPAGFTRAHWDWEGQLGGREFKYPVEEVIAAMPEQYRQPFRLVSQQAREVTESFGKGKDAYGLVHSDLYPENLLFKAGKALAIDFDDCGFGYWMWDLAAALCTWPWTEEFYWRRDALLEGYSTVRALPEAQLKHLDLFIAAQYATMVLWATVFILNDPLMEAEHEKWRGEHGVKLLRYLER